MEVDRKIRAFSENVEDVDMRRILNVDLIDKLPDTGYIPPEGIVDCRYQKPARAHVPNAVEEFRQLRNGG